MSKSINFGNMKKTRNNTDLVRKQEDNEKRLQRKSVLSMTQAAYEFRKSAKSNM